MINKICGVLAAIFFVALGYTSHAANEQVFKSDVLVIGSGGAGMAAAVSASQNGAKSVTVIEKLPILGGSTNFSGGVLNSPDPKRQNKLGIKDSAELFAKDIMEAGDNMSDPALVKALAENATDTLYWLEGMGVKVNDRLFSKGAGNSAVRSHDTSPKQTGRDYLDVLEAVAKKQGIKAFTETNAATIDIIETKNNGRIMRAVATDPDGNKVIYEAKAIILATGGFGSNKEMRKKYDPRLDDSFFTTNNPKGLSKAGNTGDGIIMAQELRAGVTGMEYIQLLGLSGGQVVNEVGADIFITREGKRFVDEAGRRDVVSAAYLQTPGKMYWVITDSQSKKNATFEGKLKSGEVIKADSVDEMAKGMGIDAKVLKNTLDRYNGFVKNKKDTDFGKTVFAQTIDKAPYYFGKQVQNVHYTMGGLTITPKAEVKDVDGKVIKGLYAAGEVTGGVHGSNRVGGNAVLDIMVYGRIAGKNAAILSQSK